MTTLPWFLEFGLWWLLMCVIVAVGWYRLRRNEPRDDE